MALTDVYGVNYRKAYVDTPPTKIHQGEWGGRVRVLREKFTFDGDGGASETIKLGKLPKGAMVLSARVFGPDLGGTGTFELGNAASEDGVEAVDLDGFIDAGDSSGQAFDVSDKDTSQRGPSIGIRRFASEVDVILTLTGATSSTATKSIYMIMTYITD